MNTGNEPIKALEEIKNMMDRGSRFVSLSGWSGIAAGICALAAAWIAGNQFNGYEINGNAYLSGTGYNTGGHLLQLDHELMILGVATFVIAFLLTLLLTYLRSRKMGVPLWGFTARKVMISMAVPMGVGALLIWRIADFGMYGLVSPACLLFYGIALVSGSKYTLPEVRYLGYLQLILGVINLWAMGYGLYFWAAGFGVLHILYGIVMWNKYERNEKTVA